MRQKPTRQARLAQFSIAMFGLLLAVLFTTGTFGGPSADTADAQTSDGPPCELEPFDYADLDPCRVPSVAYTPPSTACTGAHAATHPYQIEALNTVVCFNLAVVATPYCASSTHEVVISVINPIDGIFDSSLAYGFRNADFDGDFTNYPWHVYSPDADESDQAGMFWASLTVFEPDRSGDDQIDVIIYGEPAGTIEVFDGVDCPTVTVECTGTTATAPTINFTPTADINPATELRAWVRHGQNSAGDSAPLPDSGVEFDLIAGLAPPGSYSWFVTTGETTLVSGSAYCLEFEPVLSCQSGQVLLELSATDASTEALADLQEFADLSIAVNTQDSTGANPFTFLFTTPDSIGPPVPTHDAPDTVTVQTYYSLDADLTPPICRTTAAIGCSAGVPEVTFEPADGWPGEAYESSPVSTTPPGQSVTITIGELVDNQVTNTGVILLNSLPEETNAASLFVPDCEVDFSVYCTSGQAVAEISPFDNDARPTGFAGFRLNGGPTLIEPGVYPINNAMPSVTADDPANGVGLEPDGPLVGPDCQVLVTTFCVSGQVTLIIDPGQTGLAQAQIFNNVNGTPDTVNWELQSPDGLDTTPMQRTISSQAVLELTAPDGTYEGLAIVAADADTVVVPTLTDNGTDYTRAEVPLVCQIPVSVACANGIPRLTASIDGSRADALVVTNADTNAPIEEASSGVYLLPNATAVTVTTAPANTGIHLTRLGFDDQATISVSLDCVIDVSIACAAGEAVLSADPGETGAYGLYLDGVSSVDTQFNGAPISVALPPPDPADNNPTVEVAVEYSYYYDDEYDYFDEVAGLSLNDPNRPELGFEWLRDSDGFIVYDIADFDIPICDVDVAAACATGEGGPTGIARFRVTLRGTPMTPVYETNTQVTSGDVVLGAGANLEAVFDPGESFDVSANNGVFVNGDNVASLEVPYCTIFLDATSLCVGGSPAVAVQGTNGGYTSLANVQGTPNAFEEAFERTFFFADTAEPITIMISVYDANAIVVVTIDGVIVAFDSVEGAVDIAASTCVVDPTIECAGGAAFMQVDTSAAPFGTTTTPRNGAMVAPGATIAISASGGVYVRHMNTAQFGESIGLTAPVCRVSAKLVCQTSAGGPTGRAVLRTAVPALAPIGTTVTPGAGKTVASEGLLAVAVDNGVVFTSSGKATATLKAPACVVTATAVARCASPGIEVAVTTSGAAAAAIVINGTSYPASADSFNDTVLPASIGSASLLPSVTTIIGGLTPLAAYEIELVPADAANVAAGAVEPISIAEANRCTIELVATIQCVSEQVLVTVTTTAASTGTVQSVAVNGDANLPFFVSPGTAATITATSSDTLPGDITIPTLAIPSSCDNSLIPLAGTLYVDYDAACSADGQSVIVELATTGSAGVLAISVNGDPAAPFVVTAGQPIVVSVLTFVANDAVIIDGPALAPVCIVPTTPTPRATPTPTPTLPPAIVLIFRTGDATPGLTPDPTPASTLVPTPTPDTTPAPTAEPTPGPTSEPTPEPPPDEVLSAQASLRQHGQSSVLLPPACDVPEISLPGAVRLVRDGVTEDGQIRFVAETATLDVGTYRETISCAGQQVEIELFIYRQIGGARGEANSISRLAVTAGVLTIVLIGVPGIIARRDEEE